MRRGGRRRRCVDPRGVGVFISGGRWGPRRVRVTECAQTIKSEEMYTLLLRGGVRVRPGLSVALSVELRAGVTQHFLATVVANRVWRRGRVFLVCPGCARRCARLYRPRREWRVACRRCWGLTYESRQRQHVQGHGASMLARCVDPSGPRV